MLQVVRKEALFQRNLDIFGPFGDRHVQRSLSHHRPKGPQSADPECGGAEGGKAVAVNVFLRYVCEQKLTLRRKLQGTHFSELEEFERPLEPFYQKVRASRVGRQAPRQRVVQEDGNGFLGQALFPGAAFIAKASKWLLSHGCIQIFTTFSRVDPRLANPTSSIVPIKVR